MGNKSDKNILMAMKDAPEFSFAGVYYAKVVSVYDGDTITCIIKFNGKYCKVKVRMMHYNSAEIRTKDLDEKLLGLDAKKRLSDKVLDKVCVLKVSTKKDKYGRLLGELYHNDSCVNFEMIKEGYGKPYDGKGEKQF